MRLSVILDADLHQVTARRAHARGTTVSREINDLLRQAIAARPSDAETLPPIRPEGRRRFPVSQVTQRITAENVTRTENQEDLRHLER